MGETKKQYDGKKMKKPSMPTKKPADGKIAKKMVKDGKKKGMY